MEVSLIKPSSRLAPCCVQNRSYDEPQIGVSEANACYCVTDKGSECVRLDGWRPSGSDQTSAASMGESAEV